MTIAITVLVSTRIDPVSGRATRSRGDALALDLALEQVGADRVRVLSAGAMSDAVARDYLALGAAAIELLPLGGDDAPALVPRLAAAVAGCPLVLTGTRAEGGLGSGALPFALAAALNRPVISAVVGLQPRTSGWIVTQACDKGARRRLGLSVPAVLAVSPAMPGVPRHSHRDAVAGHILRQPDPGAAPASTAEPTWRLVPAARQRRMLEARMPRSGHARMLGAIDVQATTTAGQVLEAGTADDKARAILDYLRAHALVNF